MSKIKIKAGFLKGKNIYVPDFIRTTQDKVKKGIFDILGNKVINSIFLDLFAGSGNIGIEAISRGAKFCYFVEKSQKCIEVIKKNIKELKIEDKTKIIKIDAERFVKKSEEKFDVIFADPPYNYKIKREFIINILNILNQGVL
ncbi:MAG: RsmD family RNA methyltransferase, partial [candidate division WOR-3 bacterium]